jgi:hypothetical protein
VSVVWQCLVYTLQLSHGGVAKPYYVSPYLTRSYLFLISLISLCFPRLSLYRGNHCPCVVDGLSYSLDCLGFIQFISELAGLSLYRAIGHGHGQSIGIGCVVRLVFVWKLRGSVDWDGFYSRFQFHFYLDSPSDSRPPRKPNLIGCAMEFIVSIIT